MLPMRSLANAGRARAPCLVSQRLLGAGYTGPRESGYDEVEMGNLRAMEDQPFFMINLLNVVDLEKFSQYSVATAGIFKELARGETIYVGRLRGAPVPVKGEGIDTSDYNVMMLVKYPRWAPSRGAREAAPDGFRGGADEREGGGPLTARRAAACEYPFEGHSGRP